MAEQGIVFKNLTKRFGRLEAVKNLSLTIPHGTFLSLIGPSGCGKTTTLRMLAGFEMPSEGYILIDGQDITHAPPDKRNISMVFQHFALFPHMNVYKNVEYGLRMRKVPHVEREQRVRIVLSLLEIEHLHNERINRISGGQQQKVGLARALVTEPRILLLDEPMGSIDEALRVRTQRELRRLFERLNITFIHVTHNQLEAFAMADRIVVMDAGKLIQDSDPETLFWKPRTDFVARFVGRNNIFYGHLLSRSGEEAEVQTSAGIFHIRAGGPFPADGERTAFAVRSDLLRIDGADLERNYLEAEITFVEEVENIKLFRLMTQDGTELRAEEHGIQSSVSRSVGEKVKLSWRPEDAVLLTIAD